MSVRDRRALSMAVFVAALVTVAMLPLAPVASAVPDDPIQEAKLVGSDTVPGDEFGAAVAVSGATAIVGAATAHRWGAVYVFQRSGSVWSQEAELLSPFGPASQTFGESVALDGSTAVVGAPFGQSVFIYARRGSGWYLQAKLRPPQGVGGTFGLAVGISGDTAVVGEPLGGSFHQGIAWVYVRSKGQWSVQGELVNPDGASFDNFGGAVAISASGSTVVVRELSLGAPAYVFVRSNHQWGLEAKLVPTNCATGSGPSVAISGATVVLGGWASDTGAVCVFVRSGGVWSEQARLTASDGVTNDQFGFAVSIDRSTLVVSAIGKDSRAGAAYLFTRLGQAWLQDAEFTGSDVFPGSEFGLSVALQPGKIVVGAPAIGFGFPIGVAYVFSLE
jgi:hypothetical protein